MGKTSFAYHIEITESYYRHSFDHHFKYKLLGLPGYSPSENWTKIISQKRVEPWIIDNWTTEDKLGALLHRYEPDACIYVLFDTHKNILDRYRVEINSQDAFYGMYEKMYRLMDFENYKPEVRFFRVHPAQSPPPYDLIYQEVDAAGFRHFISEEGGPDTSRTFNEHTWSWS